VHGERFSLKHLIVIIIMLVLFFSKAVVFMQMGWKTQRAYFIDPYKVEFMELSGYLCHLKM
jgi:hypothetical protein